MDLSGKKFTAHKAQENGNFEMSVKWETKLTELYEFGE